MNVLDDSYDGGGDGYDGDYAGEEVDHGGDGYTGDYDYPQHEEYSNDADDFENQQVFLDEQIDYGYDE